MELTQYKTHELIIMSDITQSDIGLICFALAHTLNNMEETEKQSHEDFKLIGEISTKFDMLYQEMNLSK